MVRELGLDVPPLEASLVTAGARSQREVVPTVPPGWRFSPGSQGVGVLAPLEKFDDAHDALDDLDGWDIPLALERAEQLMRAGKPASALWLLQRANGANPRDAERLVVLEAMAAAYEALDRGVLAARTRQMRGCVLAECV